MLAPYLPIVILFALAFGFAVFSVIIATITGPRRYNKAKLDFYECGIEPAPVSSGPTRFPIKYFLTAMLFIVFDIELAFLYPIAVVLRDDGVVALVVLMVFVFTVVEALVYIWKKGALEWR
jgi:NADH-quinone oxidoreductase subunit A